MPIYEYKCKKCGKKFEVFQKITDDEIKKCAACHGPVEKLISLSAFHLKGSGWYVTDYGGKKPSPSEFINANAKDTTSKTESGGTSNAKPKGKE